MLRKKMLSITIIIITILFLIYIFFEFVPVVDSVPYHPPPIPKLEEKFAVNTKLLNAKKLILSKGMGAEDVEVDKSGNIYTGLENGNIVKISFEVIKNLDFENPSLDTNVNEEVIVNTGGRPLGLRFGTDGNLYVADGLKGLLKVDFKDSYKITVLSTEADGIPFRFTDHLDVASDGKIYFTDASYKYSPNEYLYDLLESRPYGRFLVYDPTTKKTKTLIKDLYFSNGVALAKDESFVLINETYRYRIWRYWLKGDKKDTYEVFYDNLPGFPDNLRTSISENFYVCLFTKRNAFMDAIHPYPILKNILSGLPKFLWPKPAKYGLIIEMSPEAKILQTLQNPDTVEPKFTNVTGVKRHQDFLFFSSLYGNWIGVKKLK